MELSIFYNGQFFVALVEYKMENKSKFIQYTFGNEPDDIEVLDFIHHQLMEMIDDVQTIVYTKNNQAYVYEISDVSDAENDTYLVKDAYDKKTEERSVELSGDVMKLSFVVPLIAYAAIAVQSKEGLILIGLGIVFLIILFILAELWRKDKKDMEETKSEQ